MNPCAPEPAVEVVMHRSDCAAWTGGRSQRWQPGDEARCDCGAATWTGLMAGFAPAPSDYSSTGTFDQGGPVDPGALGLRTDGAPALVVRVLPPADWPRVAGIEPFASHGLPDDPASWVVLVVERAGQIVGTCSLFTAAHWDCWWIDPTQPGTSRGLILRQLLREALTRLRQAAVQQVYTGVEDAHAEVAPFLTRFGFTPAGGQLFLLRIADAPRV